MSLPCRVEMQLESVLGASEASDIIAKPHKVTQSVKQCSAVGFSLKIVGKNFSMLQCGAVQEAGSF